MAENTQNKDKELISVQEAGRRGGEATASTHDREFYQEIGQKGGESRSRRSNANRMKKQEEEVSQSSKKNDDTEDDRHDGFEDQTEPNAEARQERKREIETKLILSSYVNGWNISENFIAEKNVRHEPYEFGYAAGISRPLALAARAERCNLCPENFQVGAEIYGGLGTHADFGLAGTSHYVAPTVAWTVPNGPTFKISPSFGVNERSAGFLLRFGVSYEIVQFGRAAQRMFTARKTSSSVNHQV